VDFTRCDGRQLFFYLEKSQRPSVEFTEFDSCLEEKEACTKRRIAQKGLNPEGIQEAFVSELLI
jgi:hypothetical protein